MSFKINIRLSIIMVFMTLGLIISGCFPNRHPNNPLDYETRRPEIAYMIPADEDTMRVDSLIVWFDEIMDTKTIEESFSLALAVERAPWTNITSVATMASCINEPNILFLGRKEQGGFYSTDGGDSWNFVSSLAQYRIQKIKISPANASIIYAITDSFMLKSVDNGVTWYHLTAGLPENIPVSSFDFNPSNADNTWLGTDNGIYSSNDGGESWTPAGILPNWRNDRTIVKIEIDPINSQIIYAATLGRYIYKSLDGGLNWEMKRGTTSQLPGSRIFDVVVDPGNSDVVYAATDNRGIYKSNDGGENWIEQNNGILDLATRKIVIQAATNTVYAVTGNRIFVSSDNTSSWTDIQLPSSANSIVNFIADPFSEGHLVIAATDNIYKSLDHGETWQEINTINPETISVKGTSLFKTWRGELYFIDAAGDTVTISPYRYDDVLAAYDVGWRDKPPADPNPEATKMIFIPNEPLHSNWMYRAVIPGAFVDGVWRPNVAPKDIHGMSLELDFVSFFTPIDRKNL